MNMTNEPMEEQEPTQQSPDQVLEAQSMPQRKPDYRLEMLDEELLLYHPSETKIFRFNETASLIWGLCDGEHSTEEIINLLSEAYPESAESIASDVETTLKEFLEQGCIELV